MTCGVAVCANPSLSGSSPGQGRRPTPSRAAVPRPRPHPHRKPRAARTAADARRGWRAPFLAGTVPQPRFDQRSYEPESTAGPWGCQLGQYDDQYDGITARTATGDLCCTAYSMRICATDPIPRRSTLRAAKGKLLNQLNGGARAGFYCCQHFRRKNLAGAEAAS